MWAVVPVKSLNQAKSRLSDILLPEHRRGLYKAMLADVLTALARARGLQGIAVVTLDPEVARLAEPFGVRLIVESACRGQSAAVALAATVLAAEGVDGMLTVPGDVPLLRPDDIEAVLDCHAGPGGLTIVPSRGHDGTNCLAISPPDAIPFFFGPDSFALHRNTAQRAGLKVQCLERPGLALDIDDPEDLYCLLYRRPAGATGGYLDRFALASPFPGLEQIGQGP